MIRNLNPHARRTAVSTLAVTVALGLALVPTLSASATTGGSNWWRDWYDVPAAQGAGWTGTGEDRCYRRAYQLFTAGVSGSEPHGLPEVVM